ncbi:MAG: hypothetical protein PHS30_06410 [Bacteroidales bacterium]|nr:hypothetical protein [Bacteroidales bacterium]
MKKVLLFALLFAGATAFAQQNPGPGRQKPGAAGMNGGGSIMKQLNLSTEQKAKLEKVRKESDQKDSTAFAEFRKQKEQRSIERMSSFKSVLNKEQLAKFEKMQLLRAEQEIFKHGGKEARMDRPRRGVQGRDGQRPHRIQGQGCPQEKRMSAGQPGPMHKGRDGQRPMPKLTREQRAQKQTEMMAKHLNLNEKQVLGIQEINLRYAQKDAQKTGDKRVNEDERFARQNEIKSILNQEQKEKFDLFMEKAKRK